jgi:hypothetical protein
MCLSGAKPPAALTTFSFESDERLWIRSSCGIDYTLTKGCKPGPVLIPTASDCGQPCDSGNSGCNTCGACPNGALQLGQFGPGGPNVAAVWDGYAYLAGTSKSGCACFDRVPAGSGSYTISVTGYFSSEDALMQRNGYPFKSTFEYPPPDGIVHIRLDFTGI